MKKILALLLLVPSVGVCDTKISALASTTTLNAGDIIPVVTNPGSSPANFSITKTNLLSTLGVIKNQSSLQSGATFYVSSGTLTTELDIGGSNNYLQRAYQAPSGDAGMLWEFYTNPGPTSSPFLNLRMTNQISNGNQGGFGFEDGTFHRFVSIVPGIPALVLQSSTPVQFYDGANSHFVALKASNTVAANLTFLLPAADGTSGQVLQTNGSGTLSFGATGVPGIPINSVQFDSAGVFGGTPLETVDSSSISFNAISSVTYSGFSGMTFGTGTTLDASAAPVLANTLTATYNVVAGSIQVNGAGNGNVQLTISGSTYSVISDSISPTTVGQCAVFSSTNGTVIGTTCGPGGAGTPGGSAGQLQYNSAGSFGGASSIVTASSITIISSFSVTDNGIQNTIGGTNLMDVYSGTGFVGKLLFGVGSQGQNNQFQILDRTPVNLSLYGAQLGGLKMGYAATPQQIISQSRNNYFEVNLVSTMTFNTDNDIGGGDMVFKPQNTETLRVSKITGITATGNMSVTGTVSESSTTLSGFLQLFSRTSAALKVLTPSAVGQAYYCSDCSAVPVCVSTGTAVGGVALITAKTSACQ